MKTRTIKNRELFCDKNIFKRNYFCIFLQAFLKRARIKKINIKTDINIYKYEVEATTRSII